MTYIACLPSPTTVVVPTTTTVTRTPIQTEPITITITVTNTFKRKRDVDTISIVTGECQPSTLTASTTRSIPCYARCGKNASAYLSACSCLQVTSETSTLSATTVVETVTVTGDAEVITETTSDMQSITEKVNNALRLDHSSSEDAVY